MWNKDNDTTKTVNDSIRKKILKHPGRHYRFDKFRNDGNTFTDPVHGVSAKPERCKKCQKHEKQEDRESENPVRDQVINLSGNRIAPMHSLNKCFLKCSSYKSVFGIGNQM